MKSITVRIRPDGTIEAETHGMKGEECLAYVSPLEDLLEAETVASHFTEEYGVQPAVAEAEAGAVAKAAAVGEAGAPGRAGAERDVSRSPRRRVELGP